MLRQFRAPLFPIVVAIGLLAALVWYARSQRTGESTASAARFAHVGCGAAQGAYRAHVSPEWVTLSGKIRARLPDAYGRYRHQRFIVHCADGLDVLVVNDVSIGQRIPIRIGSNVVVRGQYVWDSLGGLVHYTHRSDTGGANGWIFLDSKVYQ